MYKKILAMCVTMTAAMPAFADSDLSTDRTERSPQGDLIIVRRTAWPDFDGGTVQVEQHLKPDGSGRLIYRYKDQPEATKLYHQAFCASMDMQPSQGEGRIEGPAAGWACTSEMDIDGRSSHVGPKSIDWVTATAPSGQVPVGVSYYSTGQMAAESSVAGTRTARIGVDNGRCDFSDTRHYTSSFSLREAVGVTCIVHESRFVSTSLDVCIPKQCASNRGTQFAR
ncbi:hypothetical protein [Stenotrophomonas sp. 24(2023)]|uniref:hypothetical protein n=1 Tax=Stenotrophomonas sp. 24(2023) TaxID=3068324 RepID=UPI0027E11E0D|nr:hypothetical protein [Stenotrophomonas sp. 24(2023)]WMJ67646.1 hypothetical protein Q9R17_10445 [Stenotrophomonas sp. 24(2023)]